MNTVSITNAISKYTIWIYGEVTGITVNDLTMDGNVGATGAAFYATVYETHAPINVVFDTGSITNHTGTIFDICATCDVSFIDFTS